MTDILVATSTTVALLGTAITILEDVRKERAEVHGTSKTLDSITRELTNLSNLLHSIRIEKKQRPGVDISVKPQVENVIDVSNELKRTFQKINNEQQKSKARQFLHAVKTGDEHDRKLEAIFGRLHCAKAELMFRVPLTQVNNMLGSSGDTTRKGNSDDRDNQESTQAGEKEIMGNELVYPLRDKSRPGEKPDDPVTPSDDSEMQGARLLEVAEAENESGEILDTESPSVLIVDNTMHGRARIVTGDVGGEDAGTAEADVKKRRKKVVVARNEFRADVQIMTGDIAGQAAANLGDSFWKF